MKLNFDSIIATAAALIAFASGALAADMYGGGMNGGMGGMGGMGSMGGGMPPMGDGGMNGGMPPGGNGY